MKNEIIRMDLAEVLPGAKKQGYIYACISLLPYGYSWNHQKTLVFIKGKEYYEDVGQPWGDIFDEGYGLSDGDFWTAKDNILRILTKGIKDEHIVTPSDRYLYEYERELRREKQITKERQSDQGSGKFLRMIMMRQEMREYESTFTGKILSSIFGKNSTMYDDEIKRECDNTADAESQKAIHSVEYGPMRYCDEIDRITKKYR